MYSRRDTSANSRVRLSSPMAPSPSGSHHWENELADMAKMLLLKWFRGSEATVMGIPSRVESCKYRCMLLYHFARASGEGTAQRLKWFIFFSFTRFRALGAKANIPVAGLSWIDPSSLTRAPLMNNIPAFSSRDI